MRPNGLIAAVILALGVGVAPAVAQKAPTLPPGIEPQQGERLDRLAPRVQIVPGAAERQRKIAVARSLGLLITDETSLQPSFWLTPRQPWVVNEANMTIRMEYAAPWIPQYRATDAMPFGSVTLPPNPPRSPLGLTTQSNTIYLNDVPSDPRDWIMVECIVSGADRYDIHGRPAVVTPAGTIAVAFRPSAERTRRFEVEGFAPRASSADPRRWQFGGCELTPVRG